MKSGGAAPEAPSSFVQNPARGTLRAAEDAQQPAPETPFAELPDDAAARRESASPAGVDPMDARLAGVRRIWLLAVIGVLAAVLLAVGYVQWRQFELLDSTSHFQNDALGWSFSQLEAEHLRLRNQLQMRLHDPARHSAESVQTRYDIFVSRVDLVDHERAARIMHDQASYVPAMAKVHEFIHDADRYLGESPPLTLDGPAIAHLLDRLDTLSVPLHDLSLGASHLLYERATFRNNAIRQQSELGIALTVFQCLLLVALAAIVIRQLRALMERRRSLEALTGNLSHARLQAEAANRAKSIFLANMSHEIRTPFHGMLGMMSLLQDSGLTSQQASFLSTARESAQHLLTILNDILDISQLESGKLQVVPAPIELRALLSQVDALMRVQAQAKGLSLQIGVAADVPEWVDADATRVKQILFNLLSNAVKFTHSGAVSLSVTRQPEGPLSFKITDSGIGMDAATTGRLFQRFMQGDGSTSRRQGGTGLGLEISRNLARLMGGDIAVQSTPGVGSTFTVTLPLAEAPPPATKREAVAAASGRDRPRLRVLVAEDHPVNRAYMEAVLDKLGHHAVFCEDGGSAVRAMQSQAFDIVLMDLHMPGMDGFAAARAIRKMPAPAGKVPIVALTADAFQESRDQARDAGMEGFLTKPAHLPQLREALERYGTAAAAEVGLPAPALPPADELSSELDPATVDDIRQLLSAETYGGLLSDFFTDRDSAVADLRRAVAEASASELRGRAHALKGAALSLGLRSVAELAEEIRAGAGEAPAGTLYALIDSLDGCLKLSRERCLRAKILPG